YTASFTTRDAAGNVTSQQMNTYASGLPSTVNVPIQRQMMSATEYYPGGLPSRSVDADGNITKYDYDEGRRTIGYLTRLEQPPFPGSSTPRVTTFDYNSDGTVRQVTDPTGKVKTYEYDALGRLKKTNYFATPATLRAEVLSDAPAGYWRLGETAGASAFDLS